MKLLGLLLLNLIALTSKGQFCNFSVENKNDLKFAEFIVNDVLIQIRDSLYSVPLSTGLDTIRIKYSPAEEYSVILAKLKSNYTYSFKFNPCSFIEIIPEGEGEPNESFIRVVNLNNDTLNWYMHSYFTFIDPNQLRNRDTTDFFRKGWSGYCPFAWDFFDFCLKDLDFILENNDYSTCSGIKIYFSGGELFTLTFDNLTRTVNAKFEGYFNENQKIKIGEFYDD